MIDKNTAMRMAYAANCTYYIEAGIDTAPEYAGIGFTSKPTIILADDGIVAAIFGQTATEIIVAIRGTLPPILGNWPELKESLLDWLADGNAALDGCMWLNGLVHSGFLGELSSIYQDVSLTVRTLAGTGTPKIIVTGHSKGGSIASLLASRLKKGCNFDIECVTFASARPGNRPFSKAYNLLIPNQTRFEATVDIVPRVPAGELLIDALSALDGRFLSIRAADYCPVGELVYLSHGLNPVVGDSFELEAQRMASTAWIIARDVDAIAQAHSMERTYLPLIQSMKD